MSEDGPQLFRKESLERLSSPERLDQLLRVANPKTWMPLATAGALLLGLLVWSIVGTVPVFVEGLGILVRPRHVVELHAPGSGRLAALDVRVGDTVVVGQVLGRVARPELERQLELRRERRGALGERRETAREQHAKRTGLNARSSRQLAKSLEQHIDRSGALAAQMRDDRRRAIAAELASQAEQREVAQKLTESLRDRLTGQRELHASGIISRKALDDAQQEYVEGLTRLTAVDAEIHRLETQRLEADEQYFDRLQRVADLTFTLHGLDVRQSELVQNDIDSEGSHEREIAEADSDIAVLEQRLREETRVVSAHTGRILELHATVGEYLEPGDPVGRMEAQDVDSGLTSVTYFRVRDGKRISMNDQVRVTPDSVERERYGGILGVVRAVSALPVTVEEAADVVGNRVLATSLVQGGYQIQVEAELQRQADEPHALIWSSRAPAIEITAGTTTTVRAVVERPHPIALLFPILKSAAGVD